MPEPIVPLADVLTYLGFAAGGAEEDNVSRLLNAISSEIRRLTRRDYEGAATVYDEVYRIDGADAFTLPHVPVDAVIAVRRIFFDGTEDPVKDPRVVIDGASTTLAAAAAAGAVTLKVAAIDDIAVGDHVLVGSASDAESEVVRVSAVGTAGAGGTGLTIEPTLRYAHASAEVVVEVAGSELWRVDSAARGRIRFRHGMDYARITYRVTGEVDAQVQQACLDWLKQRYEEITAAAVDAPELASQSSESWSEAYAQQETTGITRRPPPDVARALSLVYHATGGGPI